MRPKTKIKILAATLLIFFSFLIFKSVQSSLVYYLTVSEVRERESFSKFKRLRVSGIVERGSIGKNEDGSISFNITDQESTIYVQYKGVIPDIFRLYSSFSKFSGNIIVWNSINIYFPFPIVVSGLSKISNNYAI